MQCVYRGRKTVARSRLTLCYYFPFLVRRCCDAGQSRCDEYGKNEIMAGGVDKLNYTMERQTEEYTCDSFYFHETRQLFNNCVPLFVSFAVRLAREPTLTSLFKYT